MINYQITNSALPITEADILDLEHKIGFCLPADIRNFYLKHNGGKVEEGDRSVYLDDSENEYTLKYIAPINHSLSPSQYTMEKLWHTFIVEKELIQKKHIPFAIDGGGFPYCFDAETGHIFFANLEHYDDKEKMMEPVARSLTDFINGMKTEEEAYE